MSEIITCQRERDPDLCYCKLGFTGHVHAAKISPEEWAQGVLAIDFLSRNSMATSTPKLTPKNRKAAERILAGRLRKGEGK
jgi:hypothetical protein